MATAYWYTGNADKAVRRNSIFPKYRPGHPQSLFNLGWIEWQGSWSQKARSRLGAIAEGEPGVSQKEQVEQYIAKAKNTASLAAEHS